MSDDKGFLFSVTSNLGDGHQVTSAFNLPVGAKKAAMDAVFDEYFAAVRRQEARLRLPTIEQQVAQQVALVEGVKKSAERLHESPQLNGKRRDRDEAAYQQSRTQMEAGAAKLDLLKRNLDLTKKEAEVESSECLTRAANS